MLKNRVLIRNLVNEFLEKYGDNLNEEISRLIKSSFFIDLDYSFEFDLLDSNDVVRFLQEKESDPSGKKWIDLDSKTRLFILKLKKVVMKDLSLDKYYCSSGFFPSSIKVHVDITDKILSSFINIESLYKIASKFIGWFWFPIYLIGVLMYFILCTYGIWGFSILNAYNCVIPFPLLVIIMCSTKHYLEKELYIETVSNILTDVDIVRGLFAFSCSVAYHNLMNRFKHFGTLNFLSIIVLIISIILVVVEIKRIYLWLLDEFHDLEIIFKDFIFINR